MRKPMNSESFINVFPLGSQAAMNMGFTKTFSFVGVILLLLEPAMAGEARTKAEIKELNGAPALLINGKPATGLMYESQPSKPPCVSGGKLRLENFPGMYGFRSVKSTGSFGKDFTIETEISVDEITGAGPANAGLWVNHSPAGYYVLQLVRESDGNVVQLWKARPGGWEFDKWFTLPLRWKPGKPVHLTLVVREGRIAGYVDGVLVGEMTDKHPLPPANLTLSVYHTIAGMDFIKITDPDGNVVFHDDFSAPRSENWSGVQLASPSPTFASAGVNITMPQIRMEAIWLAPGKYDFRSLDAYMRKILREGNADTYAFGRLRLNPPAWWIDKHPDELVVWRDAAGKSGRLLYASFSSPKWCADMGKAVEDVIEHIESSEYADRVIGYNLLYAFGPEWLYPSGDRFHDYSAGNASAFRTWLKHKYGSDAVLSKAWNRNVTIAGAEVPSVSDRLTGDYYEFFNPSGRGNRIGDYIQFNDESVVSAISHIAGIIKRVTGGRNLVLAYYGYHFPWPSINYSQRGHQAIDRFLACPYVDGTGSAYQYRVREAGGSTVPITTVGSLRLHHKIYYIEDDTRTHLAAEDQEYGRARDSWESANILKRNGAYAISEAVPLWYLDFGRIWFEHPDVMPAIAQVVGLHKEALNRDRRRNAEIAVIVNQRSVTYLRSSNALTAPVLCRQYYEQMPRIGAPFDTYILQDLDNIPDYKLYIFLDTFALSEKEKESIRRVVRKKGRTALWIYAPGYITENGLSDEAMSEITGIRLLSRNMSGQLRASLCDMQHPITAGCAPGLEWEVSEPVGPVITSRDKDAQVLGMWHLSPGFDNLGRERIGVEFGTGLVVKELDGWRSVWCGVPNIPASLLRGIAAYAGVHIYSDANDFLCANHSMASIHARYAGKRTIRLPTTARVVDAFTGEVVSDGATTFTVDLKKYETKMWWLTPKQK
jgi:hypothetical protein